MPSNATSNLCKLSILVISLLIFTTGYSISVRGLYEAENAIYVKTTLSGPSKTESVSQVVTCPYVVIKMEYSDKNVVF